MGSAKNECVFGKMSIGLGKDKMGSSVVRWSGVLDGLQLVQLASCTTSSKVCWLKISGTARRLSSYRSARRRRCLSLPRVEAPPARVPGRPPCCPHPTISAVSWEAGTGFCTQASSWRMVT